MIYTACVNNKMYPLILCLTLISVSYSASVLYPHTLINTEVKCNSISDCKVYYNHSWCASAGVLCIHHYCKLIPDYPCRTTQHCIESEECCVDKECTIDEECNNAIYCDGEEICNQGYCITNPTRPSCYYTGGQCDEFTQTCHQPKVRLAWRSEQGTQISNSIKTQVIDQNVGSGTTQVVASITSLIIVAFLTGLVFLVTIVVLIVRSLGNVRSDY